MSEHVDEVEKPAVAEDDSTAGKVRAEIARMSNGEQAQLRRDPGTSLAFYKLRAAFFSKVSNPETEDRWIAFVQCAALTSELYEPKVSFGTALGRAGLSELRLTRLLRAKGERLHYQAVASARFLRAKGVHQNCRELSALLLARDHQAERTRRRIAGDFFKEINTDTSSKG